MPSWQHGSCKRDRLGAPGRKERENGAAETAEHERTSDSDRGTTWLKELRPPTITHCAITHHHNIVSSSCQRDCPAPTLWPGGFFFGFAQAQKDPAPRRFATPFTVTDPGDSLLVLVVFFSCPAAQLPTINQRNATQPSPAHCSATQRDIAQGASCISSEVTGTHALCASFHPNVRDALPPPLFSSLVPSQSILSCPPPESRSRQSSHHHNAVILPNPSAWPPPIAAHLEP